MRYRKIIWIVVMTLVAVSLFDFWDHCRALQAQKMTMPKMMMMQFSAAKAVAIIVGYGVIGHAVDRLTTLR